MILCAAMLLSSVLLGVSVSAAEELPFNDVPDTWYTDAVKCVYSEGIMKGKTSTSFDPTAKITRAEVVTAFSRIAIAKTAGMGEDLPFDDTVSGQWYSESVGWAAENNLYPNIRVDGEILLNGENILTMQAIDVRRRVGMVFQRPAPFPTMSIYDNVLSGFTLNGIKLSKAEKDATVEHCLRSVALWDEVKDVLNKKGTFLSGGQQQRLCIARALAMKPDVLLMDEPTSALDPIATKHIEELLLELQKEVTILIVTHNMGQAKRISSKSMFMYLGELVEYGDTETLFSNPVDERTKAYLTGKMG